MSIFLNRPNFLILFKFYISDTHRHFFCDQGPGRGQLSQLSWVLADLGPPKGTTRVRPAECVLHLSSWLHRGLLSVTTRGLLPWRWPCALSCFGCINPIYLSVDAMGSQGLGQVVLWHCVWYRGLLQMSSYCCRIWVVLHTLRVHVINYMSKIITNNNNSNEKVSCDVGEPQFMPAVSKTFRHFLSLLFWHYMSCLFSF